CRVVRPHRPCCRFPYTTLFRSRGADRGKDRRRMGALGAAVDAGRLDVPDAGHRDGLVLGLLRARLGWLVVLGPGGERVADAMDRSEEHTCELQSRRELVCRLLL